MLQTKAPLISAVSTCATVTVTSYENKRLQGEIYSEFYKKTVPVHDSLEFLFAMERLMDSLAFPKNFMEQRTFGVRRIRIEERETAGNCMQDKEQKQTEVSKATFIIHVQFRRNATWQGEIRWVDEKKVQTFRSTLEMIKLIDDALENSNNAVQICWDQEEQHEPYSTQE